MACQTIGAMENKYKDTHKTRTNQLKTLRTNGQRRRRGAIVAALPRCAVARNRARRGATVAPSRRVSVASSSAIAARPSCARHGAYRCSVARRRGASPFRTRSRAYDATGKRTSRRHRARRCAHSLRVPVAHSLRGAIAPSRRVSVAPSGAIAARRNRAVAARTRGASQLRRCGAHSRRVPVAPLRRVAA